MQPQWKTHANDLRTLAQAVQLECPVRKISARDAAVTLFGAVRVMSHQFGQDAMQLACAELVRDRAAWSSSFGMLPVVECTKTHRAMFFLASMARGVLAIAGEANTRAALSFWACEDDPAVWERVLNADMQMSS